MSGNENQFNELLQRYIESLDKENENIDLIIELEGASRFSSEVKIYFEEARISQYLYYERLASKKEPAIVKNLVTVFRENKKHFSEDGNIWTYFKHLLSSIDLSWEQVLYNIKMSPRFADDIRKEEMNLQRIPPAKLAAISHMVDADSNKVLKLAYQWLIEFNKSDTSFAVSYREIQDCFNHTSEEKIIDQKHKLVIEYIRNLEKSL